MAKFGKVGSAVDDKKAVKKVDDKGVVKKVEESKEVEEEEEETKERDEWSHRDWMYLIDKILCFNFNQIITSINIQC